MHDPLGSSWFWLSSLMLVIAIPSVAAAQDTPPAETRSLHVNLGIGPSLGVSNIGIDQVKLVQEVGLLLGSSGLVLSLALGESIGDDVFVFQAGARLGFETAVPIGATRLIVAPSLLAGVFHVSVDAGSFGNASDTDLDLQLALDLHLPLTKNWELFSRPVALDMIFGDHDAAVRYDLIVGAALRI